MKKRNIYLISIVLILFSTLQAVVVNANIDIADTGDYDEINGKKLLFYGQDIKYVRIEWWSLDNVNQTANHSANNISVNSYIFTITKSDIWNATYICWSANITNKFAVIYHYEGGFSTEVQSVDVDYSDIQDRLDSLRAQIILDLISNDDYWSKVVGIKNDGVGSVRTIVESMKTDLISLGFTNEEIIELERVVDEAVAITAEDERTQILAVLSAERDGFNDAMKMSGIIIGIIVLAIALYIAYKVKLRIPIKKIKGWKKIRPKGKDKKKVVTQNDVPSSASSILFGE